MRQEENVWFLEPHVLRPALWEMVHERERTRGSKNRMFSLLFYGRWYMRGREHEVLRTACSLFYFMGYGTRQAENARFQEPHVLSPVSRVLWELVRDRKRT